MRLVLQVRVSELEVEIVDEADKDVWAQVFSQFVSGTLSVTEAERDEGQWMSHLSICGLEKGTLWIEPLWKELFRLLPLFGVVMDAKNVIGNLSTLFKIVFAKFAVSRNLKSL